MTRADTARPRPAGLTRPARACERASGQATEAAGVERSATPCLRLGAYTVVSPLAAGGMADVFLGRDATQHVAIKVLDPARATCADAARMFLDEARLVGMLDHPNIAHVLDVDVDARAGLHYIAMEYVHGRDLREIMLRAAQRGTSLPYEVSLAIVMQAAAGLDHAHRACDAAGRPLQLVHRDVSLSNIMVGFDGVVKLVDFGIARSTLSTVHTLPGIVRGKASYMSPEQCMGERVDHRTDVFALGVVLYELTTGARCFGGKTDFEKMLAIVRGDYLAPSDLVADYPPELEHIVRRALSADPAQRFPSCAAMYDALDQVTRARAWLAGVHPIRAVLAELFGAVREPWSDEEVTSVDVAPAAALPASPPTAPITRSAKLAQAAAALAVPPSRETVVVSASLMMDACAIDAAAGAGDAAARAASDAAADAALRAAGEPSWLPTPRWESAPAVPPRRFARGSCADVLDPAAWTLDEDEVATRGRRRRPPTCPTA